MNYLEFAKAALERAVKTTAQAATALLAANATGLLTVDWVQLASVSGLAGLVSVLTSIASAPFGGDGPSLTRVEVLADPPVSRAEAKARREAS